MSKIDFKSFESSSLKDTSKVKGKTGWGKILGNTLILQSSYFKDIYGSLNKTIQ